MMGSLLASPDSAIRRLAGDVHADVLASPRAQELLRFPDAHPYAKWWGTHWRLVALADFGVPAGTGGLRPGLVVGTPTRRGRLGSRSRQRDAQPAIREDLVERTVMRSKTISVSIERPPADVYAFVSDPSNLPLWAAGLGVSVEESESGWVVETTNGRMGIRFAPPNEFGVLDHFVTTADGAEIAVPVRVIPNGAGSEVLFTLFQSPGVSNEEFAEDAATVEKDLQTLKRVLET
jgi:hypothetical protein